MDEFERLKVRRSLTDEQKIIFDLMLKYETSEPDKSNVFALCLVSLRMPEFAIVLLAWCDPIIRSMRTAMENDFSAFYNRN